MRLPVLAATVERRLLVNYRVDPELVAGMLPAGLRPQLVGGAAVAGICLIRLGQVRPGGLPARAGIRTENAAHRIAVGWDDPAGGPPRTGVFIPLRHTSSRVGTLLGGRLFPGLHHRARFAVRESAQQVDIAVTAPDGTNVMDVAAAPVESWPGSALFADLDEASAFFRTGSTGYSPGTDPRRLDGLELRTPTWTVRPAVVTHARSSFFDDPRRFPPGSALLDTALLMTDLPVTWHTLPDFSAQRG